MNGYRWIWLKLMIIHRWMKLCKTWRHKLGCQCGNYCEQAVMQQAGCAWANYCEVASNMNLAEIQVTKLAIFIKANWHCPMICLNSSALYNFACCRWSRLPKAIQLRLLVSIELFWHLVIVTVVLNEHCFTIADTTCFLMHMCLHYNNVLLNRIFKKMSSKLIKWFSLGLPVVQW